MQGNKPLHKNHDIADLIRRGLEIIDCYLVIRPDSAEPVIEALKLLKQALVLEPNNSYLHFAYVGALRLAKQFESAKVQLEELIKAHPNFFLAKFSQDVSSPTIFSKPEWTPTSKHLSPLYADNLHTSVLWPAREGIYPRAVFFEKDSDSWWTREKLADLTIEIAVVIADEMNVAALYRRCEGPGLQKPDMQETAVLLSLPKDQIDLAGWTYLCEQEFLDVVIVDAMNKVILNNRVYLSNKTIVKLNRISSLLLSTPDTKISERELVMAIQNYQNQVDLEYIERKYFP